MKRLPRYYRCARELLGADRLRVSSAEISEILGITPSQVRRDLNLIEGAGQQGYGYNVKDLYQGLGGLLGIHSTLTAVIAGPFCGFAGTFSSHPIFSARGVSLRAVFDENGGEATSPGDFPCVYPIDQMEEYIRNNKIDILILCVSRLRAAQTAAAAEAAGVRGIWNVTNEDINLPNVPVYSTNLSDELMTLCCMITNPGIQDEDEGS